MTDHALTTAPDDVFDQAVQVTTDSEQGAALAVRALVEIQSAITIAKRFPRDELSAFAKLMETCKRPTFAKKARYKFPRGGKPVVGPSINLANTAAQCWGNIRSGFTIVPTDDDELWIQLEAWAHDAQTNVWKYVSDRFPNKIQRRDGWVVPDERDRRELVNRRASLAVRNAILQVLPFDLIEDACDRCEETSSAKASGDLKANRKATIKKLLLAFDEEYAVSQEMLERKLGHGVADIDAGELTELREVFLSLKDGNSSRADHFVVPSAEAVAADELNDEVEAAGKDEAGELGGHAH